MAEKNYLSSSQESLPLSEECNLLLLNQLGSPLQNIINGICSPNAVTDEENPVALDAVNESPNDEYSVLGLVESLPVPQTHQIPQYLLENAPWEQIKAPSSLPATENWAGDYCFTVSFRSQENVKGVQWIYSRLKEKLYVGKDVPCPINFSTNTVMPNDVYIRAMALFSSADQASEIVHRCVNHSMEEFKKNLPEAEHLVRCESSSAVYVNDRNTGRHSVVVPFENPPAGQGFSSYIYKFACFGSCSGGPNRRPLMLVFTLEKDGKVYGRQKVDLKICACPSRDMKADERLLKPESSKEKPSKPIKRENPEAAKDVSPSKVMKLGLQPGDHVDFAPNYHSAVKKIRVSEKKGPYLIKVEDKRCYDFLKVMQKFFLLYLNNNSVDIQTSSKRKFMNFIYSTLSSSSEDER